jgi:hypothetical protein
MKFCPSKLYKKYQTPLKKFEILQFKYSVCAREILFVLPYLPPTSLKLFDLSSVHPEVYERTRRGGRAKSIKYICEKISLIRSALIQLNEIIQ